MIDPRIAARRRALEQGKELRDFGNAQLEFDMPELETEIDKPGFMSGRLAGLGMPENFSFNRSISPTATVPESVTGDPNLGTGAVDPSSGSVTAGRTGREAMLGAVGSGGLGVGMAGYQLASNIAQGTPEVDDLGRTIGLATAAKGLSMGANIGGMMAPDPISLAAGVASRGIMAELGLSPGPGANLSGTMGALAGGLMGGPVGALGGGFAGRLGGSALEDYYGSRDYDWERDRVEEYYGAGGFGGLTNPRGYVGANRAFSDYDPSTKRDFRDIWSGVNTDYRTAPMDFSNLGSESGWSDGFLGGRLGTMFDQPETIFDQPEFFGPGFRGSDPFGGFDPFGGGGGESYGGGGVDAEGNVGDEEAESVW